MCWSCTGFVGVVARRDEHGVWTAPDTTVQWDDVAATRERLEAQARERNGRRSEAARQNSVRRQHDQWRTAVSWYVGRG